MKRLSLKVASIILSFVIVFMSITNVYFTVKAQAALVDTISSLLSIKEYVQEFQNDPVGTWDRDMAPAYYLLNFGVLGYILKSPNPYEISQWRDFLKNYSSAGHSFEPPQNATDDQIDQYTLNYLIDNMTIDQSTNSINFNDNSRDLIIALANYDMTLHGYKYCYSFDVLKSVQNFSDGANFSAMRRFLSSSQYKYNFWCPNQFVCTNDDNLAFVVQTDNTTRFQCYYYNFETWEQISLANLADVAIYDYDSNLSEYTLNNNASLSNNIEVVANLAKTKDELVYYNYQSYLVTLNKNSIHKVYLTLADLKADSQGQAPYYISNVWNDFVNNGTLTYNNDNSNHITYNDVISFVDSFNTENGHYPDPQQIQIIIDNNNPDDGSGGGGSGGNNGGEDISGGSSSATATANNEGINININNNHNLNIGGSTVSGNGSGTSSGIGDIFGFLSGVGEALASLVKNLGTALADLLKSLAEVINDIVVGIPDIFSGLINIVFGGLPDDLKSVIILGITVMVVYGLVKMIRG